MGTITKTVAIKRKGDGVILCENCSVADTVRTRMVGLLGHASLGNDAGILIRPCNSVHTFFMRFPIDVLFLSKQNKVIASVSDLLPWRITLPRLSAVSVVELPAGAVKRLGIHMGDELEICNISSA